MAFKKNVTFKHKCCGEGNVSTKSFFESLREMFDEDLREQLEGGDVKTEVLLLVQIIRELRKEGPEEKSKPIGGFQAGTDASKPYHPF